MSVNVHIQRIKDTQANVIAGLDDSQTALLTDQINEHVHRIGSNWYYPAMSKYTANGSVFTYLSTDHDDITARGEIYAAEYIHHLGDTDTYWRYQDDRADMVIGGVTMLTALEGSSDYLEFNAGEADVDFIVNTVNANSFVVDGGTGLTSLSSTGTVKTVVNLLSLTNTQNASDMEGTGVGILARGYYYDAVTPAAFTLGSMSWECTLDPTNGANQNSRLKIKVADGDGELSDKIVADKDTIWIGGDPDVDWTAGQMTALGLLNDHTIGAISAAADSSGGMEVYGYRQQLVRGLLLCGVGIAGSTEGYVNIRGKKLIDGGSDSWTVGALTTEPILDISNNTSLRTRWMYNGETQWHLDDLSHGMTDYAPTTCWLDLDYDDASVGGAIITGLCDSTPAGPALKLRGLGNQACGSNEFVAIVAAKPDGTGVQAIDTSSYILAMYNNTDPKWRIDGEGDIQTFGDQIIASGKWIGLGTGKGRLTWTDAATDTAVFGDCYLGVGPSTPIHKMHASSDGDNCYILSEVLSNHDAGIFLRRNQSGGSYNVDWYNFVKASTTNLHWFAGGSDRLILTSGGDLTITSLAGSAGRTVKVDANGKLYAE